MQQTYRRTPMPKCDFNKVALHIFRIPLIRTPLWTAASNFKYLREEYESNMLNLVKQKEFYSFEYISDFENFKEKLPEKKSFMVFLRVKKLVIRIMNIYIWKSVSEIKTMKVFHDLNSNCKVLLVAVFEKIRNNS